MTSQSKTITVFLLALGLLTIPAVGDAIDVGSLLQNQYGDNGWEFQASNADTGNDVWLYDLKFESQVWSDGTYTAFVYIVRPTSGFAYNFNLEGDWSSVVSYANLPDYSFADATIYFGGNLSAEIGPLLMSGETLIFSVLTTTDGYALSGGYAGNYTPEGALSYGYAFAPMIPVPEPSSLSLLLLAGLGLGVGTWKRKKFR